MEPSQCRRGFELKMPIQQIAEYRYHFPRGESGKNCADTETIQAAEEAEGQKSRGGKADHVKGNLDLGIGDMGDLGQLPGKEVCRDNGEAAALGQSDAKTDEQITDNKIENLEGQSCGEKNDPCLVDVQKLSKHKAYHKAAKVGGHKLPPEYHETQYQNTLKEVGPCTQRQHWEYLGKGVGDTGNGGDPRSGAEHQHNAEAVDKYRYDQRQLSLESLFSSFISTNTCFLSISVKINRYVPWRHIPILSANLI